MKDNIVFKVLAEADGNASVVHKIMSCVYSYFRMILLCLKKKTEIDDT